MRNNSKFEDYRFCIKMNNFLPPHPSPKKRYIESLNNNFNNNEALIKDYLDERIYYALFQREI